MANYFYFDRSFKKQGPVNQEQLQELAAQGVFKRDSSIVTDTGDRGRADYFIPLTCFKTPQVLGEPSPGFFDIGFIHFLTPVLTALTWWFSVFVVVVEVMYVPSQVPEQARAGIFFVCIIIGVLELMVIRLVLEFFVIAFRIERHLRDKLPRASKANANDFSKEPQV